MGGGYHRACCCGPGEPFEVCAYDQSIAHFNQPGPTTVPVGIFPTRVKLTLPSTLPYIHYVDFIAQMGLGGQDYPGPWELCSQSPTELVYEGECGNACLEPDCWLGENRYRGCVETHFGENTVYIYPPIWNRGPASVWTRRNITNQYWLYPRVEYEIRIPDQTDTYPPGLNACDQGIAPFGRQETRLFLMREVETFDLTATPGRFVHSVWDTCIIWIQLAYSSGEWFVPMEIQMQARNLAGYFTTNQNFDPAIDANVWDWLSPTLYPANWTFSAADFRFAPYYDNAAFAYYGVDPKAYHGTHLRSIWGGTEFASWCYSANAHPWAHFYSDRCLSNKTQESFGFGVQPTEEAISVVTCPDPCAEGTADYLVTGRGLYHPVGDSDVCLFACDA